MPDRPQQRDALQESILVGHEQEDVRARSILINGLVLMIGVPVVVFILWWHFMIMAGSNTRGFTRPTILNVASGPERSFPKPQLIRTPGEQLRQLRATEDRELSTYGWINSTQGVMRIPIEQAMKLVAQRGLPVQQVGNPKTDGSEYELVIKRRMERDKLIREGKVPEE